MVSVAKRHNPDACGACQAPYAAVDYSGSGLCSGCHNVFRTAKALFQHNISAEEELIPTLIFARISGRAGEQHYRHHYGSGYGPAEESVLSGSHPALKIVRFVDQVPVVRVKPSAVTAEKHPGTQILKQVRIRTLSKRVKSEDVAKNYEQRLQEEGAQWDVNNHGGFHYDCLHGYLELTVTEGSELSSRTVEGLKNVYRHPAFHFPPPKIVEGVHEAMKTVFAKRLDFYGKPWRKTPEKLIPAFAAWHIGGRADEEVPPEWRTGRVPRILNRHLLQPCGLPLLPESSWTSADTIWRDVTLLCPRFIIMEHYALCPSHRS